MGQRAKGIQSQALKGMWPAGTEGAWTEARPGSLLELKESLFERSQTGVLGPETENLGPRASPFRDLGDGFM